MAQRKTLSNLDIQAIVKAEIQNADGYGASSVSADRAEALDYYFARPFGNEVEGRSQVVDSAVRDTVEWIMPSLVRVFTSGEDVVAFQPESPADIQIAKQATDYVNYIWNNDNHGFLIFYSWFKDALISKNGVVKIWWDKMPTTQRKRYSGLPDDAFGELAAPKNVQVSEHTKNKDGTHDAVLTISTPRERVCIKNMPPEEFLISKEARNIEDARLVGHRSRRTISDLRSEFPKEKLDTLASDDASVMTDAEETKRNTVENITAASTTAINEAMRQVWVTEAYIKLDVDGDGIAEMRKVTVAGSGFTLLSNEAWDGPRPFASITPIINPHRFYGTSIADLIKDLQLIKSTIWRQLLDNLYLSNNQREVVIQDEIIDPDELLSSAPGRKIRVKSRPDAVTPLVVPSIAEQALAGLQYLDQQIEDRTGVSERTQGLGADDLHETASGERMLMSAAMGKVELIARIMAETGVRDAFRLILKLVCMYQQDPRLVQLPSGWTQMDTRTWNPDMHLQTQVALGMGDRDQQMMYSQLIGKMQEMLLPLGFVTPENIGNAAEVGLSAMGFKGVERFITIPQGDAAKKPIQLPPPNQKPGMDPQTQIAVAQTKAQAAGQTAVQVAQIKAQAQAATTQHQNALEAQRDTLHNQQQMQLEAFKAKMDQVIELAVAHINAAAKIESARVTAQYSDGADAEAREAAGESAN